MLKINPSLDDARTWLLENRDEGVVCPCCDQFAKVYRWSLYGTAARYLLLLYRAGGATDFVHTEVIKSMGHRGQGDASRLRLWGLVERGDGTREDGGKPGYWRLTELGRMFALGLATIPKYVFVYNGELLMTEGEQVTIREALGKKFDYDELMQDAHLVATDNSLF